MATFGTKFVFGHQEPRPITNLPSGKARLRLRGDDFAQVFVKTDDGIRRCYLKDAGENWEAMEVARNTNL